MIPLPVGASLRGDAQQECDRDADRRPNEDRPDGERADSRTESR